MHRRSFLRTTGVATAAAVAGAGAGLSYDAARAAVITPDGFASTIAPRAVRGNATLWWSGPAAGGSAARGSAARGPAAGGAVPRVAVTFDDGPTRMFTAQVLDLLGRLAVPATFFVVGALVERLPDLVRRARDGGHQVENHSYDHISAAATDAAGVLSGMARGADAVEKVTGVRPRWYRPPRGEVTSATMLAARELEQDVALWSIVREGSDGGGADDDAAGVRRHLLAAVHDGAVVDLHDGIGRSAWVGRPSQQLITRRRAELAVLADVLSGWRQAGYTFVTLSELIPPAGPPSTAPAAAPSGAASPTG